MRLLPLLVLLFPVLELAILIKVGSELGVLLTFVLLFIAAAAGIFLMRIAGPATMLRMRARLQSGEQPEQEMLGGLMLGLAGLLLLIPGFISDFLAILCLLPVTRSLLLDRVGRKVWQGRSVHDTDFSQGGEQPAQRQTPPQTIEGEWERRDD